MVGAMMMVIRMTGKELREVEEGFQHEEAQVVSHMTINFFSPFPLSVVFVFVKKC